MGRAGFTELSRPSKEDRAQTVESSRVESSRGEASALSRVHRAEMIGLSRVGRAELIRVRQAQSVEPRGPYHVNSADQS